jgi:hypothetical protein
MMKSISLPAAVALLLCSASWAQKPTSKVKKPSKPSSETSRTTEDDSEKEQELRTRMQEQAQRELSDPSGHIRPDLWKEGVAHMRRMKVVSQIGPAKQESHDKK